MDDVLNLILGGGRGTRLHPLTRDRSKPAVPIAGKYRLIDIPISNCINSGLNRIYVLTQFNSVSLHRHITNTYKFDPFGQGFVEILAAQQTNESLDWYQGTADAVRQNLRYVQDDRCRFVLILSGDQLYRMDYRRLTETHRERGADVTIAVLPVPRSQVAGFGIVRLDDTGRVVGFVEKPKTEEQLAPVRTDEAWLRRQGIEAHGREYLANMGIYLFNRDALIDLLSADPQAADFGKEIYPRSIRSHRVQAYVFDGYWEDVGTIKSYHEVNLALAAEKPPFDFHSPDGVIYTHMRNLPAAQITGATIDQSLVSDGCVIRAGTRLERSVVGVRSAIGRNVTIRDSVILGANDYEGASGRTVRGAGAGVPPLGIGDGTVLERAILDKNCRIGRGVQIVNRRQVQEEEGENYVIRDGIVVIPNGAVVPDGTVI
jgi:glucose-1-phosphate adenylyltransferase